MIWVLGAISNHFSMGHIHCPTQNHILIIFAYVTAKCAYNIGGCC